MQRRDFITFLGGAAAVWPLAAWAQQGERVRRIGVLVAGRENDSTIQRRIAAFRKLVSQLASTEGRNLLFEYRFVDLTDPEQVRRNAAELVALAPDVIVANTSTSVRALKLATRTVPIVFPGANDPVGGGIVESFAQPGGNATGIAFSEFSTAGKNLGLLKEMVPGLARAAVLRDPGQIGATGVFGAIQAAATSLRMEVRPIDNRDAAAIERGIAAFAAAPNGGMVVQPSATSTRHRDVIINLAARYKLPAVYADRVFADDGGLLSYAPDIISMWRGAASYVDRILRGEKPADLPVQLPTKYETVLNMKTAKTLGLDVPTSILLRADEVVE
jgi:putative ABC transport system substrate-binding protein